jgi:hypothetical protein
MSADAEFWVVSEFLGKVLEVELNRALIGSIKALLRLS